MGHPNTKKHKGMHGGYRHKPTKAEVKATFDFFAVLKTDKQPEEEIIDEELDALFGDTAEKVIKIGTQLRLF